MFDDAFYRSHHMFTSAINVQQICQPLFSALNLNYFDYARLYNDGRFIGVNTDAKWSECFFRNRFPVSNYICDSGIHLWQSYCNEALIKAADECGDHNYGITFFILKENYSEIFDFAAPRQNREILSTYLNHTDIFIQFQQYFYEHGKHLMEEAKKHAFILPDTMKSSECYIENKCEELIDLLRTKKTTLYIKGNKIKLTNKQKMCLYYLTKGFTTKKIAEYMQLSSRTVEAHISAIKDKFCCRFKSDIVSLLHDENLVI